MPNDEWSSITIMNVKKIESCIFCGQGDLIQFRSVKWDKGLYGYAVVKEILALNCLYNGKPTREFKLKLVNSLGHQINHISLFEEGQGSWEVEVLSKMKR